MFPIYLIWIVTQKSSKFPIWDAIKETMKPNEEWGPADPSRYLEWKTFKKEAKENRIATAALNKHSYWKQNLYIFLGKYRK